MKDRKVELDSLVKKIVSNLVGHGVKKIAVFGSYARGKAKPKSDLDLLVEFSKRKNIKKDSIEPASSRERFYVYKRVFPARCIDLRVFRECLLFLVYFYVLESICMVDDGR
jgi:predicted nucleotidyltransferase